MTTQTMREDLAIGKPEICDLCAVGAVAASRRLVSVGERRTFVRSCVECDATLECEDSWSSAVFLAIARAKLAHDFRVAA